MLGNASLYAGKKRKKPVPKIPKALPHDGIKSNPSKRHRDRLNGELDKLTSLLPFSEDIRTRLDKLSVLRLSVGYLKVKSFFSATMQKGQNGRSWPGDRSLTVAGKELTALTPSTPTNSPFNTPTTMMTSIDGVIFSEGDLLLQALNGFVLVATGDGSIFYTSPTIQSYLGFHQSDVLHQSVYELIHADDRGLFRRQLHFALNPNPSQTDSTSSSLSEQGSTSIIEDTVTYNPQHLPPENSSFLERTFSCRFRCLLDNSSGFLALNFRGRLKYVHGQNKLSEDGNACHPQLALFAIATPLQPPSILEIRSKTLIFQTKHKLDFTPMGIDTRGKVVLGYNEIELCMKGSGYQFIHAADMMHCADNHLRMIKTGNSGFTVFRLLTKSGEWVWVQANARLVFKAGKPDFIVARQRALTNEEGEEQLRIRRLQAPFTFATGEAVLYDVGPTLDVPNPCPALTPTPDGPPVDPDSLLGCMLRQDHTAYCQGGAGGGGDAGEAPSLDDVAFKDTHALVSVPGQPWLQPGGLVAGPGHDRAVRDMVETLQQILGNGDLRDQVGAEPAELKDWEDVLLRMSDGSGGGEPGEAGEAIPGDLDDILSNDILLYVEEQLVKEGQIPAYFSSLHGHSLPNGGAEPGPAPTATGNQPPVTGTIKLSHMGSQMASMCLNGPALQQSALQSAATPPAGLQTHGSFGPALVDSCMQTQHQFNSLQITAMHNNFGLFPSSQVPAGQAPPTHVAQPAQNQCGRLDPCMRSNPAALPHSSQWVSPSPVANPSSAFVDAYSNNISREPGLNVDPSPSSCLQGHFTLQTNNGGNHGQSWSLRQQRQLPASALDGHQYVSQAVQYQHNTLPADLLSQAPESPLLMFPPTYTPAPPVLVPSNSCMFGGGGSVHGSLPGSQNSTKMPCYFQGLPSNGPLEGGVVLQQDEAAFRPLSCQMAPGLSQDNLLAQQQPYLSYSDQSQLPSHPIIGNDGFPFSSLPSGSTFYSESK